MASFDERSVLKYNSLSDKHLMGYFSNERLRRHLVKSGLITKHGDVVSDGLYKTKLLQKEHRRRARDMLTQAIIYKAMEMEKSKQIDIRMKLAEISKPKLKVRPITASNRSTIPKEDSLIHETGANTDFTHRSRNSTARSYRSQSDFVDNKLPATGDPELRQKLRIVLPNEEKSSKPMSLLDSLTSSDNEKYSVEELENANKLPPLDNVGIRRNPKQIEDRSYSETKIDLDPKKNQKKEGSQEISHPQSARSYQSKSSMLTMMSLLFHAPSNNRNFDVTVEQQPNGGNTLILYKESIVNNAVFQIISHRHKGFPFSLTFYIDNVKDSRISTCCEYKHRVGKRMGGPTGHFTLYAIERNTPCFRCLTDKDLADENKPPKPKNNSAKKRIRSKPKKVSIKNIPEDLSSNTYGLEFEEIVSNPVSEKDETKEPLSSESSSNIITNSQENEIAAETVNNNLEDCDPTNEANIEVMDEEKENENQPEDCGDTTIDGNIGINYEFKNKDDQITDNVNTNGNCNAVDQSEGSNSISKSDTHYEENKLNHSLNSTGDSEGRKIFNTERDNALNFEDRGKHVANSNSSNEVIKDNFNDSMVEDRSSNQTNIDPTITLQKESLSRSILSTPDLLEIDNVNGPTGLAPNNVSHPRKLSEAQFDPDFSSSFAESDWEKLMEVSRSGRILRDNRPDILDKLGKEHEYSPGEKVLSQEPIVAAGIVHDYSNNTSLVDNTLESQLSTSYSDTSVLSRSTNGGSLENDPLEDQEEDNAKEMITNRANDIPTILKETKRIKISEESHDNDEEYIFVSSTNVDDDSNNKDKQTSVLPESCLAVIDESGNDRGESRGINEGRGEDMITQEDTCEGTVSRVTAIEEHTTKEENIELGLSQLDEYPVGIIVEDTDNGAVDAQFVGSSNQDSTNVEKTDESGRSQCGPEEGHPVLIPPVEKLQNWDHHLSLSIDIPSDIESNVDQFGNASPKVALKKGLRQWGSSSSISLSDSDVDLVHKVKVEDRVDDRPEEEPYVVIAEEDGVVDELDVMFSNEDITFKRAKDIFEEVGDRSVTSLTIRNCELPSHIFNFITNKLESKRDLRRMELSGCEVEISLLKLLAKIMHKWPLLDSLILSHNVFVDFSLFDLVSAISYLYGDKRGNRSQALRLLDLSYCGLQENDFSLIIKMVADNTAVENIILDHNPIQHELLQGLIQAMNNNSNTKTISIKNCVSDVALFEEIDNQLCEALRNRILLH